MQSTEWAPEHSECLRELLASGMSYARIAAAINAKFKTSYTRNAAIGRGKRMGLAGPDRPADLPRPLPRGHAPRFHNRPEQHSWGARRSIPAFESAGSAPLRCVEIDPRHLSLLELEAGDCRYPYGGDMDGEAITFCGHPQRAGSSYCSPHFYLSRNPDAAPQRSTRNISLRLVEAA